MQTTYEDSANPRISDRNDILFWFLCFFILLGADGRTGSLTRYALYTIPLLGLVGNLIARGQIVPRFSARELLIGGAILAYGIFCSMLSRTLTADAVRQSILIAMPFFSAAYLKNIKLWHIKVLGVVFSLAILIAALTGHAREGSFSWSNSTGLAETTYSFPLTAILLTLFLARSGLKYQVAFTFVSLASLKRISVIGAVLAVAYNGLCKVFRVIWGAAGDSLAYWAGIIVLGVLAIVGLYLPMAVVFLNHYVHLYYLSPEEILQGRYFLQTYILNYDTLHKTASSIVFGHGVGQVSHLLALVGIFSGIDPLETLVHNDFIRMYFEGGLVFLAGYCFMLIWFYGKNHAQLALLIYQFSLFLTDNTLVYTFHMVTVLICLQFLRAAETKEQREEF